MGPLSAQEEARIDAMVSVEPLPDSLEHVARRNWADSFGYGVRGMGRANFSAWFRSVLDRTLDKATLYAVLDRHRPHYVYGWICFEYLAADIPVIHYVYLKEKWRNQGLLARLASAAGVTPATDLVYTFKTPHGRRVIGKHVGSTKYLPIETYLKDHRQ